MADGNRIHIFKFPRDAVIPCNSEVYVYTCPGRMKKEELDGLPTPNILWKNLDGSLRRKEVLNNGNNYSLASKSY